MLTGLRSLKRSTICSPILIPPRTIIPLFTRKLIATRRLFFSEAYGRKPTMLKLQAILHDDSVGLEFMTDDASEAEEVRQHWLTFDCVARVLVLDEPGWVSL